MGHLSARVGREETNWRSDVSPNMQDNRNQRMLDKHDEDLYRGDGPGRSAGIVARINQLEEEMITVKDSVRQIKRMFWAIILLLLTLMGGVAADFAKDRPVKAQQIVDPRGAVRGQIAPDQQ